MSEPGTVREALIAEAIGDAGRVLDRAETLIPALDGLLQALTDAGGVLSRQLEGLEVQMAAITQTARTKVVQHVVQHIDEATRRAREAQSRVMADAARALFDHEIERALQRLVLEAQSIKRQRAWFVWWTHAGAVAVAAAASWTLAAWFYGR